MTFESFCNVTLSLLTAFKENVVIFVITLLCAIPLGLLMTFGSMSKFKPLKWLVRTFVWIIRGTPLMLQLFIFMYGPGLLFGIVYPDSIFGISINNRMIAALLAFIIN